MTFWAPIRIYEHGHSQTKLHWDILICLTCNVLKQLNLTVLYVLSHAVCGTATTGVFIADLGNGQCESSFIKGDGSPQTAGTCSANLFGANCSTYLGSLSLFIQNKENRPAATYVQPTFQKWLDALGLGGVVTAGAVPCVKTYPSSVEM
jgi:hypothetical protein